MSIRIIVMIHAIILYLDPGPGSLILQATIALVTGAVFYIALARQRIRSFFKKHFAKKDPRDS